ncbi:hypothetical protein Kisp01_26660 [Kineosporia sp. NBRC 101677]|nr:hypothetical protein Kisp01_26660 [Kineosporia sp. NBRC 101677]
MRTARDALRRLAREGWAEQRADGGYYVTGESADAEWDLVHRQVEALLAAWSGEPRQGRVEGRLDQV